MRRRGLLLVMTVLILGAAAFAYVRVRPSAVDTVAVQQRELRQTLAVAGRIRPISVAEVGSAMPGVVQEVNVREGDRVAGGDVLVRLDQEEPRAAVAQAEARLSEVEARARDEIRRAELELEQARRDLERITTVFAEGGLTRQRVEQAEQRAADAASRLDALRSGTDPSGPSAAVTEARAALEIARARLAMTELTAPYDGVVLERLAEPGDAVQPGGTLVTLAAEGPLGVVVFPSEENLSGLDLGAPAIVSADAYPDRTFPARISFVAPLVDADQGTVEVRLDVDEPPPYLRPGMTLSVNIQTGRRENATVLPAEAVRGLGTNEPWVALVTDGRVERRPVRVGLRGDGFVEILDGIPAGEAVVRSSQDVEPGDRVRIES